MSLKDTWGKAKKRPDPLTSIALTIPVFLIYHLGILVVESQRGEPSGAVDSSSRLI